jgi:hypothetical protein
MAAAAIFLEQPPCQQKLRCRKRLFNCESPVDQSSNKIARTGKVPVLEQDPCTGCSALVKYQSKQDFWSNCIRASIHEGAKLVWIVAPQGNIYRVLLDYDKVGSVGISVDEMEADCDLSTLGAEGRYHRRIADGGHTPAPVDITDMSVDMTE